MPTFVAVDLGASSGRVANAHIDRESLAVDIVHRFPMHTIGHPGGGLTWDIAAMLDEVRRGLVIAARRGDIVSIGVDAWGVDHGLLDPLGHLLEPVHAYRSSRTAGVMEAVTAITGRRHLYDITGTQFLPFNTVFQLVASKHTEQYATAWRMLMIPDLVAHALCGSTTGDVTSASTTQLLDIRRRRWSSELLADLDLRSDLLPELHEPGVQLGVVAGVGAGVDGTPVIGVAGHDTASAVAATPLAADDVYISCGTWSLVGCERRDAITGADALVANVTNELGVDGSVRLLKNVTGLWLLEECRRWWSANEVDVGAHRAELLAAAAAAPGGRSIIDPDGHDLAAPGDLPARIAAACAASGQPIPTSPAEVTRTILDSLAVAWRTTVSTIERITGTSVARVHLVGGGAAIPLLRQLCAEACQRPVVVGPVEAAALGNALVQAVAAGVLDDVAHGRRIAERYVTTIDAEPTIDWDPPTARFEQLKAT